MSNYFDHLFYFIAKVRVRGTDPCSPVEDGFLISNQLVYALPTEA